MTGTENEVLNESRYDKLIGKEYTGFKGQAAVDKLAQEKQGHVKAAFYREDIGEIDLIWGNSKAGLKHIIERREQQGIEIKPFLSDLSNVIESGSLRGKNSIGNFEILHNGKMAIISPELNGEKLTFLLTAFKTRSKK